jgi:muramoyltetrapeptide carboxypeptidase
MSARWPRGLPAGGRIHLWAPSSPAATVFPRRFGRGADALQALGYEVRAGASCAAAEGAGTLAPKALADELHQALANESCHAVMAVTGGWAMLPVLPLLELEEIAGAGKPIIGYSDVSSLVNVVAAAGLVAFHGPMVMPEFGEGDGPWWYTVDSFQAVVGGLQARHVVEPAPAWSDEVLWWDKDDRRRRREIRGRGYRALSYGIGEGPIWGGNVGSLCLLAGTGLWPAVPDDAVVLVEAWQIAPDEWWARLEQLRMCGVFERASAVVVGRMGQPRPTATGYDEYDDVVRMVVPAGVPVLADVDAGHTEPMCTLPIGGRARVTCAGDRCELALLAP